MRRTSAHWIVSPFGSYFVNLGVGSVLNFQ